MALSNWDTLTIDQDHKSCGEFCANGYVVAIRKNWIQVYDSSDKMIMTVQHGSLTLDGIEIHATRGPQSGIFCVVFSRNEDYDIDNIMIACGVYGFKNEEWTGVSRESLEFLKAWVNKREHSDEELEKELVEMWQELSLGASKEEEERIKSCIDVALTDMKKHDFLFEEPIRDIDLDKAMRSNQGDDYLSEKHDLGINQPTPVGEGDDPIMIQLIRGPKNEKHT